MKILVIGDVVAAPGMIMLKNKLRGIKSAHNIDFTIVNGENANGIGITQNLAQDLFDFGADVITLGNHAFANKGICNFLDDNDYILRPANFPPQNNGIGYNVYDVLGYKLLVMNLIGRCDMKFGYENPFLEADKILKNTDFDIAICEIHAQATSEKQAMGFYLDGRVSAVYGTHTHVQTNDKIINPKGTGFICDIGMCGPIYSVLGVDPAGSIAMFRGDITERFTAADGPCRVSGAIFDIDTNTKKCLDITLINQY